MKPDRSSETPGSSDPSQLQKEARGYDGPSDHYDGPSDGYDRSADRYDGPSGGYDNESDGNAEPTRNSRAGRSS